MKNQSFKQFINERMQKRSFITIAFAYILFCLTSALVWCISFNAKKLFLSLSFILIIPLMLILEFITGVHVNAGLAGGILFLPVGAVLGFCFNLYMTLPFLDTAMHILSGVIFASVGFAFAERFFGKPKDNKRFYGFILFAICFSISISVFWEFYEYVCSTLTEKDMMADSYVYSINSGILSGIHAETVRIDGITETIIHYGNGKTYVIDGYLDIGLIDTMTDLGVCVIGALSFAAVALLGYMKYPKLNSLLLPETISEEDESEAYVNV